MHRIHAHLPRFAGPREENFREVCDAEGLAVRGPDKPEKTSGVQEPDPAEDFTYSVLGQIAGSTIPGDPDYLRPGTPVDEDAPRVIVGVGRVAAIGPQVYFGNSDPKGDAYPIWSRTISQDFPEQGFRLPYQEYLAVGYERRTSLQVAAEVDSLFLVCGRTRHRRCGRGRALERLLQSQPCAMRQSSRRLDGILMAERCAGRSVEGARAISGHRQCAAISRLCARHGLSAAGNAQVDQRKRRSVGARAICPGRSREAVEG